MHTTVNPFVSVYGPPRPPNSCLRFGVLGACLLSLATASLRASAVKVEPVPAAAAAIDVIHDELAPLDYLVLPLYSAPDIDTSLITPTKITDSGYILFSNHLGDGWKISAEDIHVPREVGYRYHAGTFGPLYRPFPAPADTIEEDYEGGEFKHHMVYAKVSDINESGHVVGIIPEKGAYNQKFRRPVLWPAGQGDPVALPIDGMSNTPADITPTYFSFAGHHYELDDPNDESWGTFIVFPVPGGPWPSTRLATNVSDPVINNANQVIFDYKDGGVRPPFTASGSFSLPPTDTYVRSFTGQNHQGQEVLDLSFGGRPLIGFLNSDSTYPYYRSLTANSFVLTERVPPTGSSYTIEERIVPIWEPWGGEPGRNESIPNQARIGHRTVEWPSQAFVDHDNQLHVASSPDGGSQLLRETPNYNSYMQGLADYTLNGVTTTAPASIPTALNTHSRYLTGKTWNSPDGGLDKYLPGHPDLLAINAGNDILACSSFEPVSIWRWAETDLMGAYQRMALNYTLPPGWVLDSVAPSLNASRSFLATLRPALPPGAVQQSVPCVFVPARLAIDLDRDGVIEPDSLKDYTMTDTPFRFWSNDDNDGGSIETADIPGSSTPDGQKTTVQGVRDLVDFFPVYLDIKQLLTVLPPSASVKYKLKQADEGLRFVYTDLNRADAFKYLKDYATGNGLKDAEAHRMTIAGYELDATWLDQVKNADKGVILVEGRNATDKPMVLSVEKADGTVIAEVKLEIRIVPVETMFRHLNLHDRGLSGLVGTMNGGTAQPEAMGDPAGFPDSPNSDSRWLIFVHGFNVSGQASRGWNAEMFKRAYWSGNKSRFVGVSWFGNPDDPAGPFPADYHLSMRNAMVTAPALSQAINALSGSAASKSMFSHSLGCGVISSAIADHGMNIGRVCFVDAALALECFDGRDPNVTTAENDGMTPAAWKSYDKKLYAANWYALFDPVADDRGKLTWSNRFTRTGGGQRNASAFVYNFYSSTEDVLAEYTGELPSTVAGIAWDAGFHGSYGWVYQEKGKGNRQDYSLAGVTSTHLGSYYGGWGFNLTDPADINDPIYYQADGSVFEGGQRIPLTSVPGSTAPSWQAQFRRAPLFDPGYGPNTGFSRWIDNSVLRGPTWIAQLYDTTANTTGGSAVAAVALNQDQLLAEAIPALTWPVGTHPTRIFGNTRNIDLPSLVDQANWPRNFINGVREWRHSDMREVAYIYQYAVFDEIVTISKTP